MKYMLKKFVENPFLCSKNNIVTEVNNDLINLTGYSNNELIGKSLSELSNMLRINTQIDFENLQDIENGYSCFMFTKEYEPREIIIYCKNLNCKNEKTYFIKQDLNCKVNEKFDFIKQLYTDNKTGFVISSVPELIILKANENFLNFLDEPYNKIENIVGKKAKEIITGFEGSNAEEALNSFITEGRTNYFEEFKYDYFKRGVTYWNSSIMPIFIKEKLKYIIHMTVNVTEKVLNSKLLQERLKVIEDQKEQFETVIENIAEGVVIVNKEGKLIKENSKTANIYKGNELQELVKNYENIKCFDILGNEITDENRPIKRALKGEKIKCEKFLINVGDKETIIQYNATPIFDANGNISMGAMFYNDITELYNNEKVIKEQNEKLNAIMENMSDKLVIFDKDGNITKITKPERNCISNYEEIKTISDFYKNNEIFDMDGNLILKENSSFTKILKGENVSKCQVIIKSNDKITYTELNGNPIYDCKGNFIAGILLIQDITDRLKHEEALLLKTQNDLFGSIIENLDIGYIRYSYKDLKIIDINNKAYSELKQIEPTLGPLSSVKGKNYYDIFNDSEKHKRIKLIQNYISKKSSVNYINRKVYSGREEKFYKIIFNPLFGLNNQACEMITISIDVTDEVKAKNEMEETLKIQDEIFSNISHELKTPLNVIFSTNQLMQLYLKDNSLQANKEKITKGINIIKQNCYRFTKLINNVIDVSKIESGFFKLNLSNENIVNITEEIVQSLCDYVKVKGLNIIFDTNIEEKIIICDPDKIERVILNLISNSIKFTDKGGSIFVNIHDTGETVEISVKDTGIGMDKKHVDNIFKRFHQIDKSLSRNAEGSGIGLSVVKSIVNLHDGKISVESKQGEGSIFKIELPARKIENPKVRTESKSMNTKIEMINIEFSDIYSDNII